MTIKIKFVAKVIKMSGNRSFVIFPKEVSQEGKKLRGRYVKAAIKELELQFVGKVSNISSDRTVIIFPKEVNNEVKKLRGRDIQIIVEEINLQLLTF